MLVHHGNVLVIEDDRDSAESLCLLLMQEGFGVRLVKSRDDAVSAMACFIYQYILMDLSMPGLDPKEFMIFAQKAAGRPKVILLSGTNDLQQIAGAIGADAWFSKPYDFDQLLRTLKSQK